MPPTIADLEITYLKPDETMVGFQFGISNYRNWIANKGSLSIKIYRNKRYQGTVFLIPGPRDFAQATWYDNDFLSHPKGFPVTWTFKTKNASLQPMPDKGFRVVKP